MSEKECCHSYTVHMETAKNKEAREYEDYLEERCLRDLGYEWAQKHAVRTVKYFYQGIDEIVRLDTIPDSKPGPFLRKEVSYKLKPTTKEIESWINRQQN